LSRGQRRLAAIMFTDMAGYTALGQRNESLSLALVEEQRKLIRPILARHNGREVKTMGDAFLVEFQSVLDAVRCAYDIQRAVREYNISLPEEQRVHLRIGIHLGDVVESEGDISGDAVNVASRIERLAEADGVCVTRQVYDGVQNKFELRLRSLGTKSVKNVSAPIEIYGMVMPWEGQPAAPAAQFNERRVAVLPFANMSADSSDEYFADGLTEELISTMSRIGGLRVIARTSVMGYKGGGKKIDEIAEELGVGTILEGSVRKAGERARITVQLIDSRTSEHLWVESYDRDLKDVFAIQTDISKTVAEALKVRLTSQERAVIEKEQTADPEAHTLYLKGRYYWNERTQENVRKALEYFEQAVKIDPAFALAHSGLADCYNILGDYVWMPLERAQPLAREHALRALQIDDSLAEAHASYAVSLMSGWEFGPAESELRRAIELRPNYAPAYHWYALLLLDLGRLEEAYQKERLAAEIDPYSRVINLGLANSLYFLERYAEAEEKYDQLIELNPEFAAARMWKSGAQVMLSEFDAAIREAEKAFEQDKSPVMEGNLAWVYALAGRRAEAQRIREGMQTRDEHGRAPAALTGMLEFALGNTDEGFRRLEKGLADRDTALLMMASDPWFKPFRSDARWKAIAERLGLPKPAAGPA
jgi:adenylate cyclase